MSVRKFMNFNIKYNTSKYLKWLINKMTKRAYSEKERRERVCVEKAVGKKCKGMSNGQMNCMYREKRKIISGRFDSLGRMKKEFMSWSRLYNVMWESISFMMYSSMRCFFFCSLFGQTEHFYSSSHWSSLLFIVMHAIFIHIYFFSCFVHRYRLHHNILKQWHLGRPTLSAAWENIDRRMMEWIVKINRINIKNTTYRQMVENVDWKTSCQ